MPIELEKTTIAATPNASCTRSAAPKDLPSQGGRFRAAARLLWLSGELLLAFLRYGVSWVKAKGRITPALRTQWLHESARSIIRVVVNRVERVGELPRHGLVAANHLGYLDILLIAAVTPARFVSKSEVKSWPVFGFFARCAGTIFIDRSRRHDTARANDELRQALRGNELLVLFPEGTSTDGSTVLPFRSSLLAPVVQVKTQVTAAFICYSLSGGDVRNDVSYWGDMTLVPHLFKLLTRPYVSAKIAFTPVFSSTADRKELARHLHSEVLRLKNLHSL